MTTDERVPSAPSGTIFLSYARGDGKVTAKRLRDALGKGAKVWQDIERIEGGDWAREIQLALGEAQTMVALLTPCAVGRGGPDCKRENDSVCLDEIYYARFASRPVPIVPVMVRNCEPPFVIYRLHYHDFTQVESEQDFEVALEALKKDLVRAARGETQYRSFVDRLAPLDFENFLGSKRRGFVGRDWLFQEVAAALSNPNVQALLIEGQAGLGKSSFLAEFIHRNQDGRVMAYHCCQADTPSTLSCAAFVRTIASMIASQHPAYAAALDNPQVAEWFAREKLEQDPASAFEQGILAPLSGTPPPGGGLRLLVIDALDEALLAPPSAGGGRQPLSIVELLSTRYDRFPSWLKLLATTRPEHAVKDRLILPAQVLKAEDPRNGEDLKAFIRARLREPVLQARLRAAGVSADEVEAKLSTLAAGNFLYASQVLNEIATQMYDVTDLDKLPPTLKQKYTWFFARQFPTKVDFAPLRELLEVLVASEIALPHADLARALGKRPEQLAPALARLASFIRTEPGPSYAVFHKSMVEWLTDPARSDQTHFASSLDGHARIADHFLETFENEGAAALSRYALAYLPAHLAACADGAPDETEKSRRLEQLVRFVLDAGVQSHEFQRPSQLAEALRLALARAARGPSGHCLRLVFESAWGLLSFRRSRLKPDRMFALAAAGDLDGFARELDAYPAEPSFRDLAALLGAWLAHRQKTGSAAAFRARLRLSPRTEAALVARIDAELNDLPSPLAAPTPDAYATELHARGALAEAGGADLEGMSGFHSPAERMTVPNPRELEALQRGQSDEVPVMLSELHGPTLVAYATSNFEAGRTIFRDYIAIQASNQYPIYRDLSLYKLVPSIVRHPDGAWVLDVLLELAETALSGTELEFSEPASIALAALASRNPGQASFQETVSEIEQGAATLAHARERGDLWGEHRRRFAAAAEAKARILEEDSSALLDSARSLPRGYSGMEAYARLTLAESLLVCGRPGPDILAELGAAEASAQNIQDPSFCALTTARCSTLRRRFWSSVLDGSPPAVEQDIRRFERGDTPERWATEHEVGRAYPARNPGGGSLGLPRWMLDARSLADIAALYQLPLPEIQALNTDISDPATALVPGRFVRIPDEGFRALLAPFFSALALTDDSLADVRRASLIQRLVPLALLKPTALHTVLGRLAIAAARANLLPGSLKAAADRYVKLVKTPRKPAGRHLAGGHAP